MILLWRQTFTGAAEAARRYYGHTCPTASREVTRTQNHRCCWIWALSRLRSDSTITPHPQWETKFVLPGKPLPNCQQWLSKGSHFVSLTAFPLGMRKIYTCREMWQQSCLQNKINVLFFLAFKRVDFVLREKRCILSGNLKLFIIKSSHMWVLVALRKKRKDFYLGWRKSCILWCWGVNELLIIILICNHKTADLCQEPLIGPPPPSPTHTLMHAQIALERGVGNGRCYPANLHKYAERLKY